MDVGIAFDLKSDFPDTIDGPEDRLEEYDSEATVDAIAEALAGLGHHPRKLGGGRAFLREVLSRPPELVFNIAEGHGSRSREAHVPSVLEMLGIPTTHSDPLTLALTLDKALSKRVATSCGVPTPPFALVAAPSEADSVALEFPVIAKPASEGSSMGIRSGARVGDRAALPALVEQLLRAYRQPVLVEEYCPGPELTVGVLGQDQGAAVIGVMEIGPQRVAPADFVYSLDAKRNWQQEVAYHVPPRQPRALVEEAERVALAAYRALGCRDVARVDLRCDRAGQPCFLEVNPLPGLNPRTGDLVILAERSGLPFTQLIGQIVQHARARYGL